MRFVVDTNILAYAANRDCPEHGVAKQLVEDWLRGDTPWALTWSIVYEFLRLVTHPRVFRRPLSGKDALSFLEPLLDNDLVTVLGPTERHARLLLSTMQEVGRPAGNLFHDLHIVVLMREHGISEIMTADTDFRKFPSVTATDPVH